MSRQVDVKALVSHIVKGDGAEKCRICLGDTSEGQVYLGDTVMMDGEKPVTLAELLHLITGVEVEKTTSLPDKICRRCYAKLRAATPFLRLAKHSARMWHKVTDHLLTLEAKRKPTNIYIVVNGEEISTHSDYHQPTTTIQPAENPTQVLDNLSRRLKNDSRYQKNRERRKILKMSGFYQCPECHCTFTKLLHLNQHLKYMGKRQCEHCNEIIDSLETEKHYKQHGFNTVSCKVCFETFESVKSLVKHKKSNHSKGSAFCLDCKRTFKDQSRLTTHRAATHADQVCVGCGKRFSSRMCYVKHMGICQQSGRRSSQFICDHCGKEYQFKDALKMHMINVHLVGPKFQCHVCGKKMLSRFALEEHSNTHDPVLDRFVCDICGLKYSTRQGYRRHSRRHLDDGSLTTSKPVKYKLKCKFCSRMFAREHTFNTHMKAHKLKEAALQEQPLFEPEEQAEPTRYAAEPIEQVIEIIQLDEPVQVVKPKQKKIVFI